VPSTASLAGFVTAALVLLIIPGPGVLYILARSLSQGQRAGVVSAAGLSTGVLVHVAAATIGLSALVATSASAFSVVKGLGAGYLVYLGIRTLMARDGATDPDAPSLRSSRRLFWDGVIVSALNPKIAVFFLAFLPQFTDPALAPVSSQVMFLGVLYALMAFVTDSTYAVLAARIRKSVGGRLMNGPVPRRVSGVVYIGLGVGTALADQR